jgi:hypothetical protein
VKQYTRLSTAWLDGLAFALMHYRGRGDLRSEDGLLEHLSRAADVVATPDGLDFQLTPVVADACLAVARRLEGVTPAGSAGLEFRDMETGEAVDPEMFTTTVDGQASVWSARVVASALNADWTMVESLVDHQYGLGDMPLLLGFRALLLGGSMVADEGCMRADIVLEERSYFPPDYWVRCGAGGPFGGGAAQGCLKESFPKRVARDERAARHVLETGHTIFLEEE